MLDWATILETLLNSTQAHTITNYALYLIVGLFAISLVFLLFGKWRTFTTSTPALLTSIGILGTFTGVVIGLLDFDPKNIDSSIEMLLSGLKTAFITSIAGMVGAILFKILIIIRSSVGVKTSKADIVDVEPRDILNAITDQSQHLIDVKKGISGSEESSIAGQLKMLRVDVSDNHREHSKSFEAFSSKLWTSLDEVSEVLSKSATEQIVEALKNVISDFNKNLTEQFGENFKALDSSVSKLVDWQNQYSSQLEKMIEQYASGVTAITAIEASVTNINTETKAIPDTMSQLKTVLQTNQQQIDELSRHLEAFKDMKEQAVSAIPEMQKHVEKTVEEISKSSQKASEGYQVLVKKTENVQETFTKKIEQIQNQLESTVTELVELQVREMKKSFKSLEDEVSNSVELSGKAMNKQLEMIDDSLSREVSNVMDKMGKALASISGQFVDDYSELTSSMHRITQQAKRFN